MGFNDSDTKKMLEILSQNKIKKQMEQKQLRQQIEHATDVLSCVWLCVAFLVVVGIISTLV